MNGETGDADSSFVLQLSSFEIRAAACRAPHSGQVSSSMSTRQILWPVRVALTVAALSVCLRLAAAADVSFTADGLSERLQIVPNDGSLIYGESDVEMNATGFALALRRRYHSSNASDGVFGRGWACVLDRRIETRPPDGAALRDELGETTAFAPAN